MARPAEKARAMLNKWVKMREEGNTGPAVRGKRPHLASECNHLNDAEHYRNQIVREISGMIAKIQNPALGEHTIRDLNDDINKRLREKFHWNKRIKELGGVDYNAIEKQKQIEEGDTQFVSAGPGGYRYFGAAKDLPGVKELLENRMEKLQSKKRAAGDIYRHITPSYFGWRDEEDGVLLAMEDTAFGRQKRQKTQLGQPHKVIDVDSLLSSIDYLGDVPTQDEMAQILLEEKRKSLLERLNF
jgi:pre-mRNA-splicing factor ISY1